MIPLWSLPGHFGNEIAKLPVVFKTLETFLLVTINSPMARPESNYASYLKICKSYKTVAIKFRYWWYFNFSESVKVFPAISLILAKALFASSNFLGCRSSAQMVLCFTLVLIIENNNDKNNYKYKYKYNYRYEYNYKYKYKYKPNVCLVQLSWTPIQCLNAFSASPSYFSVKTILMVCKISDIWDHLLLTSWFHLKKDQQIWRSTAI